MLWFIPGLIQLLSIFSVFFILILTTESIQVTLYKYYHFGECMKNLFVNCALTQQKFVDGEEIIVIPVTSIVKEDGDIYLGTPFLSTFNSENPLGFDSLSTNNEYKKVLSVLKSYLKDISLITNKNPIQVAQVMASEDIILHNKNRITNSIHPWQEHELNVIFIKKNEFDKLKAQFEETANKLASECLMVPFTYSHNLSQSIKIEASHLFSKINQVASDHLNHLNIHFLRNFYIHHIYNQEKANIIKMGKANYDEFIKEFKELVFVNSLHDKIVHNFQPLKKVA